jgi:prepilin-type processing-associated H-X9-DG protein
VIARIKRSEAATLLELLLVVMIIAILAALLLPSLAKSKLKARRAQCIGNLKQHGVAFHMFAHDHQSRFPMQVSTNDGGSLEFMRLATNFGGEIYFSFRHYQAMARELDTPKILVCPTDTRLPADDFYALKNDNISYFITGTAEYDNPQSILSGDRNIDTYSFGLSSVLRFDRDDRPGWTAEMHQFQGNLLFADSHVEGVNNNGLRAALQNASGGQTIVLAPVPAPPAAVSAGPNGSSAQGMASASGSPASPPKEPGANGTSPGSSGGQSPPRVSSAPRQNNSGTRAPGVEASNDPVPAAPAQSVAGSKQPTGDRAGSDDDYRPDTWPAFIGEYITKLGAKGTWLFLLIIGSILVWLEIRRRRANDRKSSQPASEE